MADQESIAKRAHELYLQRGSVPGHELDDWLQAEMELSAAESPEEHETPGISELKLTSWMPAVKSSFKEIEQP